VRVGVFGGTFDPIHLGHLVTAEQCREQARLDQVLFIPAARPPHKLDRPTTPWGQRVEMLDLALAGHTAFRVDQLEKDRPGPSYTADTLRELHQRLPGSTLHLILGADCLPDLPGWHEPVKLFELAQVLIVARAGWPTWPVEKLRAELRLPAAHPLSFQVVQAPLIDVASRDLRERVRERRSIRYLVPRAVECYIETHDLYRSGSAEKQQDAP
jgi:nicotinate-nucleotide adenylyltransferase